jgi:hypothetical protein
MRPPLAGKRAAALRLAGEVRRRLEPVERVLPVRLPGFGAGQQPALAKGEREAAAAQPTAPTPEDAAARIDAARERLQATIDPPGDSDA